MLIPAIKRALCYPVCLLFALSISFAGFAQKQQADSLEKVLQSVKVDSSRLNVLEQLCAIYTSVDPVKKYQYSLQYRRLAVKLNDTEAIADADNHIGIYYGIKGNPDSALHYFKQAYNEAARHQHLRVMGRSLTNTGYTYDRIDNYRESIKCYFEALSIFKKIDYQKGINQCCNNLGAIYYDLKQYQLAESYFSQYYKSASAANDEGSVAYALCNLGNCYTELKNYPKAKQCYDKSMALRQKLGDVNGVALVLKGIGVWHMTQGRYQYAVTPLLTAYQTAESRKDQYEQVAILNNLADAYLGNKNFGKAERAAAKALMLSETIHTDLGRSLALDRLVSANKALGKTDKALAYLTAYVAVKDSLLTSQALKDVTLKEFGRVKAENNELTDDVQKARLENKDYLARIDVFTYLIITITLLLAAVVALLFVQYRRNKEKQMINKLLALQKEEITTINRELADINGIKNKLFSIVSHDLRGPLATLQSLFLLYREGELQDDEFRSILNRLEGTIISTGSFLDNLLEWSKSQLEGITVTPKAINVDRCLQENVQLWDAKIALKSLLVTTETQSSVMAFADPNMFNLVIRNLLSNAVKFCRPGDEITLNAKEESGTVLISVSDNGPGISATDQQYLFNLEHLTSTGTEGEKGNRLGLILCRDMILQNKGEFWVESAPGLGTTFWIRLPLATVAQSAKHTDVLSTNVVIV